MTEKFTWVTNTREKPDSLINCKICDGVIIFSIVEITRNKSQGKATSTPCKHCKYHPGFPPEPFVEIPGKIMKLIGYNGQWEND